MVSSVLVNAQITQQIFSETLAIPISHNDSFTVLDLAHTMENDALSSFKGISLVSPSPSEASLVTLPTGLEDPLQLTWALPPDEDVKDTLRMLRKEMMDLKNDMTELRSRVLPLADAIHLRCMLDAWIHENGFGAASGSRPVWLSNNKTRLSKIAGIPEKELEGFLEYAYFFIFSVPALTLDSADTDERATVWPTS